MKKKLLQEDSSASNNESPRG